jgi:hypothetical protein
MTTPDGLLAGTPMLAIAPSLIVAIAVPEPVLMRVDSGATITVSRIPEPVDHSPPKGPADPSQSRAPPVL